MLGFGKRRTRLNLALQGGGTHGAFTWGVLDRLLEDGGIDPAWISGTSAGAVNAVALACGLAQGGRDGARAKLEAVWTAVAEAGVPDLGRLNPFLKGLQGATPMGRLGALFSPYDFNPLGFDPLRRLLEAQIDFDRVRAFGEIELLIAATDVATGRARLFRRTELTIEALLASACLPTLHHAIEIDGRAYWDGGFSANPDLVTLAAESPAGDSLLVLLNPIEKPGIPRSARTIAAEVNRVTFTQPLVRDVAEITTAIADEAGRWRASNTRAGRLAQHRYHLVDAGRHTAELPPESKVIPSREVLAALKAAGRGEAAAWLEAHRSDIGRRSSVDLAACFLGPLKPLDLATADATQPPEDAEEIAGKL